MGEYFQQNLEQGLSIFQAQDYAVQYANNFSIQTILTQPTDQGKPRHIHVSTYNSTERQNKRKEYLYIT